METTRIERLLKQKEGIRLEFKEAATELDFNTLNINTQINFITNLSFIFLTSQYV